MSKTGLMIMAATVSIDYHYRFDSSLLSEASNKRQLRLATSGGTEANPYFFNGCLATPKQSADLLLAMSSISRTRFFSPGEIRARMLAAADPVVTSDGRQLRFEVFSVCCGAYARLDLNEHAVNGEWFGKGTTNVDFNAPMRAALASVMNSESVALRLGADRVELESRQQTVVERKVKLPVRWMKGFVEVQIYQSGLRPTIELPALELAKVIRTLPQQNIMQAGSITYIVPSGKGLRLSQRQAPGAVAVGAISRLKALEPIIRYAKSVRVYNDANYVSAFELTFFEGCLFFVLSPNAARGFSGEGQALSSLTQRCSFDLLARVRSALAWQDNIDLDRLSSSQGVERSAVFDALQLLGSRGLVGFDLSTSAFFHRELPFDLTLIEELHPRVRRAKELVEQEKVTIGGDRGGIVDATVKGSRCEHFVQITEDGCRCTCDWFTSNQGERGPCSHILAAEMVAEEPVAK